jgi:hypothetical protein
VAKGSLAEKVGLSANDLLVSIAGIEVFNMTHDQVRVFSITHDQVRIFNMIHAQI